MCARDSTTRAVDAARAVTAARGPRRCVAQERGADAHVPRGRREREGLEARLGRVCVAGGREVEAQERGEGCRDRTRAHTDGRAVAVAQPRDGGGALGRVGAREKADERARGGVVVRGGGGRRVQGRAQGEGRAREEGAVQVQRGCAVRQHHGHVRVRVRRVCCVKDRREVVKR